LKLENIVIFKIGNNPILISNIYFRHS